MSLIDKNVADLQTLPCFDCEEGRLHPVAERYSTSHPLLGEVTIPDVTVLHCNSCSGAVLGETANHRIETFLAEAVAANQLSS